MQIGLYKRTFTFALYSCLICFSLQTFAQSDPLKKGNASFEEGKFREALIYYNRIERIEKSAPILFKRGVCYYEINQLDNALTDFRRSVEFGFEKPELDYYTGLIQHHKGLFKDAASYYKRYLNELKSDDDIKKNEVRKLIKQCGRAIDLSYRRPLAILNRLPAPINTAYDEVSLIESPSVIDKYYFTSNKPNTSSTMSASDFDVYSISKKDGEWLEPKRMKYTINKRNEEVLVGFTNKADGLYFYRGPDYEGEIMLNKGIGDKSRSTPIEIDAKFSLVNSDVFFFDDNVILFSAKDAKGYGGYDLYASVKKDGAWSIPQNLGPQVNSASDELNPFLSADGSELYFSSNRDESIGGYDVFFSSYLFEADRWSAPENLGIPINSPGDDTHFSLGLDGKTAMLSSTRKNAFGGSDVYIASFLEARGLQSFDVEELVFINYRFSQEEEVTDKAQFEEDIVGADNESEANNDEPGSEVKSGEEKSIASIETGQTTQETLPGSNPSPTTPLPEKENEISESTDIAVPVVTNQIEEKGTAETHSPIQDETSSTTEAIRTPSVTKKELTSISFAPIYYTSGLDLINEKNEKELDRLVTIMLTYPRLEVAFESHAAEEGILQYKLFSSLKVAERLQTYIEKKGIDPSRIRVKGLADSYPIALTEREGGEYKYESQYNSRIEFRFYNYDPDVLYFERADPDLPNFAASTKYDLFSALIEESVVYKVQIAMVNQMYRGMSLDYFNDAIVEEDQVTGLYAYTIGLYDEYADALRVKREMDRFGVTDAQVVAYYNGRRLKEDQLVYYVNDFPDLKAMMNYNK